MKFPRANHLHRNPTLPAAAVGRVCALVIALMTPATLPADEPSPPDVLDLVVQNDAATAGPLTFEAVIKQKVDSAAELEIDDRRGAKLESGERTKRLNLQRGGAESRARSRCGFVARSRWEAVVPSD